MTSTFSFCHAKSDLLVQRPLASTSLQKLIRAAKVVRPHVKRWHSLDGVRTHEFLSKIDHDRIVRAIAAAEAKTSGEIRVYLQRGLLKEEALAAAKKQFRKLGMQNTKERNAVLIFVAPRARKFAVIGDSGVHEKCGEVYWRELIEKMRAHFQNENFNEALLEAIEQTGKLLAQHFPKMKSGKDELPNEIVEE